jgi:hypothetical protein
MGAAEESAAPFFLLAFLRVIDFFYSKFCSPEIPK